MSADTTTRKSLPFFVIEHVPKLTALAASVYSTMLFPDDGKHVDRFTCAQAICLDWRARYEDGGITDSLPIARGELFSIFNFLEKVPIQKLGSLSEEAISAGQVLKFVLLLDRDPRSAASVKKAVDLLSKYEPINARTLMNRWSQFKGVSHLWAAFNDFGSGFQSVNSDWRAARRFSFMKDPRPVLAIAEHYRNWGTHHESKGSKGVQTLIESQTWATPAQIGELPNEEFFDPQRLYVGLSIEAREFLERYRHK